jgi:hypothetical protein
LSVFSSASQLGLLSVINQKVSSYIKAVLTCMQVFQNITLNILHLVLQCLVYLHEPATLQQHVETFS